MTRMYKMPSVPDPIFDIHSFEVEKKTLLICISDLVNMFDFLSVLSELLFPFDIFYISHYKLYQGSVKA